MLKLGRSTDAAPNEWGISDPRVSREHAVLRGGGTGPPTAMAVGRYPIVRVRDGIRLVLQRGELTEV